MIAAMVLSNLMYVVGAVIAATLLSGFIVFRHRRPKSLEAGIEMFSRELKALQPERRSSTNPAGPGFARVGADGTNVSGSGTGPPSSEAEFFDGEDPDRGHRETAAPGTASPIIRPAHRVDMRPASSDPGYSTSHGARAPSPDIGEQPG